MGRTMENLVSQGFELAIFGMGTVFVFLTLLILATHCMSLLVQKFEHETSNQAVLAETQIDDHHLLTIISAAIAQHKNKHS